jgi:hypothetical protein
LILNVLVFVSKLIIMTRSTSYIKSNNNMNQETQMITFLLPSHTGYHHPSPMTGFHFLLLSFSQLNLRLLNFLQCCVWSAHLVIMQDVVADTRLQTEGRAEPWMSEDMERK